MPRLSQAFFDQPTCTVAKQLLGQQLCRRLKDGSIVSGIIVETEAYLHAEDAASHSFRGPKPRNASMFKQPGTLYVYSIHAKYCMNVVTEPEGQGAAVLIRAVEPRSGVNGMAKLRGIQVPDARSTWPHWRALTQGPGKLCAAFDIDCKQDGVNILTSHEIWIESTSLSEWTMKTTTRIGISQATHLQLRYFVDGNQFVSGLARDHSLGRRHTFHSPTDVRYP